MAFTVEDGTGVAEANSYVELAFAEDYFTDRGNAAWTGADSAKQAALIQATDYIEGRFGRRFIGEMASTTQGLSWPRTDTDFEETEIPVKLQRATCEYAVRALTAALAPDPTVDASGVSVVNTRKKLGPLEKEFQVVGSGHPVMFRPYPAADMLLTGLLEATQGRVIR
jgi:hypothetical protein